tara:strand:+ start:623 stop:862 length:240 start_codon:yes stop_codon:yes gene_type:complete
MTETLEMRLLREHRNYLLNQSDWTVSVDSPLSDSKKAEWKTYRQALRDITKTANPKIILGAPVEGVLDKSSVTFPTKPS